MTNKLAQIDLGVLKGFGNIGLENKGAEEAPGIFNQFFSGFIGLLTIIAFLWFVINFFLGAFEIITAGGDKGKLENARRRLMTGIIGIVVVIAAIFIVQLIGSIIGIPDILKPTSILDTIGL